MAIVIKSNNFFEAINEVFFLIKDKGKVRKTRNTESVYIPDLVVIDVKDPTKFTSYPHPSRKVFPPAQFYEVAWVLSGRNDMLGLELVLKRARQFSDNFHQWRGGYGPRIHWNRNIFKVIELLNKDPETRRAILPIFFPEDVEATHWSLDIPCSIMIHFLPIDDRLDARFFIRSNDAFWGFTHINFVLIRTIQRIVAYFSNKKVGHLQYIASDLHVYKRHMNRLEKILKSVVFPTLVKSYPWDVFEDNEFDNPEGFFKILQKDLAVLDYVLMDKSIKKTRNKFLLDSKPTDYLLNSPLRRWWLPILAWKKSNLEIMKKYIDNVEETDVYEALELWMKKEQ